MRTRFALVAGTRVPSYGRIVLLLLCTGVTLAHADSALELVWTAPLALLGLLAAREHADGLRTMVLTTGEGLVTACAVVATGSGTSGYLPYLIAPAFAGGFGGGLLGGVLPVGAAAATVLLAPLAVDAPTPDHLSSDVGQWVVLALLVAAVAAWVHAVLGEQPDLQTVQAEAYRLLTELRSVARQLPGTLDPGTTGEAMLQRARDVVRYDGAAVLVALHGGDQLTVVARNGHHRPQWDVTLADDSPLVESWVTQQPRAWGHQLPRRDGQAHAGSSLVVPLVYGDRTFGLVVMESGVAQAFAPEAQEQVRRAVSGLAVQLQTGLVFDEVRELATHEERRRLAREIHDGIAQELASLAYSLDTVAGDLEGDTSAGRQVEAIRHEVRRLVTELRMSLFDLRSDVDPDEGLGAAIARHVRTVGSASGLTVHLSLNEAPVRLAAETEAELLRIVQEAVANARKHAQAANLWVTCTIDPPLAAITVEDDGVGVRSPANPVSHGMAIMQERAHRIRAELEVGVRVPRGTTVRLTLGRVPS